MIKMENGQFVIDGKPVFLYGGEFHYFRSPKGEWAHRLDRLKEAGCNLVSTYVPWVWHEPAEGEVDLTGETRPETDLKSFLELVREKGLYCIVRPGPYVMAEVRLEGIPPWVHGRYPEVVARRLDGGEHPNRIVTYLHPTYLEKVNRWYDRVCGVIAPFQVGSGGPVILFQLCNEIGMLHWVSNTSDYHPVVLDRFRDYLAGTYGSLDGVNRAYRTAAGDWRDFLESAVLGEAGDRERLHWDWSRHWREMIRDYVNRLKAMADGAGIEVPYLVNVHGFKDFSVYSRGVDYPIGLSQLYRTPEVERTVLAGDFYPGHIGYDTYHDLVLASALTKAVSRPEQPLFSAEFQSGRLADRPRVYPQDLDLNARTCIAHGMNALNYYMFVAGENDEDIGLFGRRHEWQAPVDSQGNPRPSFEKARHIGRMLQAAGERLTACPKRIVTHLAFTPDHYMTETVEPGAAAMAGELAAGREGVFFDGVGRLLTAANLPFKALDVQRDDRIDPAAVPSLWMYGGDRMEEEIQRKLIRYVEEGGKLVLFSQPPTKTLDGAPCRHLADAFGIPGWRTVTGIETAQVLDIDSVKVNLRLEFDGALPGTAVAWDRHGEKPAASLLGRGNGKLLLIGLGLNHDYNYQLEVIRRLAETVDVRPVLTVSDPDLSVTERSDGESSFLFLHNYDEVIKSAMVEREGEPLFGGQPLTLAPRSGAMLPLRLPLGEDLRLESSTMELLARAEGPEGVHLTFVLSTGPTGRAILKSRRPFRLAGGLTEIIREEDGGWTAAASFSGCTGEEVTLEVSLQPEREEV